jgi:hypothetical protein
LRSAGLAISLAGINAPDWLAETTTLLSGMAILLHSSRLGAAVIHSVTRYRSVAWASSGWALVRVRLGVKAMLCTACGAELILTNVVPDDTVAVRGVEHHTFICSGCHVTERRVVFIKDGREADAPPMPMQAAPRMKRASTEQDEHVVAPGLLSRVVALLRGQ